MTLDLAYAECRSIAKREAKNFYYAFVALPAPRRDSICAIYAFMRRADDLSDDESLSIEARRGNIDSWLAAWRQAASGAPSNDPVFIAVRDAVARFSIPLSLLDELVAGVTMDLEPPNIEGVPAPEAPCPVLSTPFVERAGNLDSPLYTYTTFADLYRYCYLVASVVGLVCIRIFGYTDPRAEKFAEETGIAFQLTNILRDVAEDAARNRVYLPLEDLAAHGVALDSLLRRVPGTAPNAKERELFRSIADRAEEYYKSAQELIRLIEPESRPALRVLVSIYHELLNRIIRADYDVFTRRASVPTVEKMSILAVGLARMAWVRVFG